MYRKFIFLSTIVGALLLTGAGCLQFGSTPVVGPLGMFRSLDKGENWQQINSYPTPQGVKSLAGVKVYRVFLDPSDPNALYLATRGQGLFYSYNKGESWRAVDALAGTFIYGVAVDPQNKCVLYVTDGPRIYKTLDCGRTWKSIYTEQRPSERVVSLAVDFSNSHLIYAAFVGGDVLTSADGGVSWQAVKRFGFQIQHLVADPLQPGRVYVAAYQDGLFRSDDSGKTWIDLTGGLNGFSQSTNFYRLVLHPSKKDSLFWISKYGILRSDDAGTTWTDLKLLTPPGGVGIFSFAVNPGNDKEMYYAGTLLGEKNTNIRSTFYKTVDGGKTWVTKKLPSSAIPVTLNVHPTENGTLFMGFTIGE